MYWNTSNTRLFCCCSNFSIDHCTSWTFMSFYFLKQGKQKLLSALFQDIFGGKSLVLLLLFSGRPSFSVGKRLRLSICCQICLLETDSTQHWGSTLSISTNACLCVCVCVCVYLNWALLGLGDRVWLCCSFSCLSLSILSASRKYVAVMWLYWFDSRALRRWGEKSIWIPKYTQGMHARTHLNVITQLCSKPWPWVRKWWGWRFNLTWQQLRIDWQLVVNGN